MAGLLLLQRLPSRAAPAVSMYWPDTLPRLLLTMEDQEERAHCSAHTVPGGISQVVGNAFPIFWESIPGNGG